MSELGIVKSPGIRITSPLLVAKKGVSGQLEKCKEGVLLLLWKKNTSLLAKGLQTSNASLGVQAIAFERLCVIALPSNTCDPKKNMKLILARVVRYNPR